MKGLVSLSCGKNSVSACKIYLENGVKFDTITYIPYLNDDIPLISKVQFDFIEQFLARLRSYGVSTYVIKGISYYDFCTRILTKGKNKGKVQSYPCFIRGRCGFARDSKIKSIQSFMRGNLSSYEFLDIGLCADELDRKKLVGNERSILQEMNITDKDCFAIAESYNALSPKYATATRDGCVLCPHAKASDRFNYFMDYPRAFDIVLDIQRKCLSRGFYPLRNKRYFIENEEFVSPKGTNINMFGDTIN